MVEKITVMAGLDKGGRAEKIEKLEIRCGQVLAVAGPTGSGKTQLIADIEQYTEEETLTGRRILINDQPPDRNRSRRYIHYLVAQVSQNMNFVIDASIEEFLSMHAQIRGLSDPRKIVSQVLDITNQLSGEPVSPATHLTQLSGGQSRALMVADVALISNAPVVLIDEIENAGIDRLRALQLLKGQGKIVLVVSHDPTLILMADHRVVMKNGGMENFWTTSPEEKTILERLAGLEREITDLRNRLRAGKQV